MATELQQPSAAQHLVKGFVEVRQEPIMPINHGPFDILSYIFEICGEEDYRTTLKIALVCRHWRETVLTTPRAWAFLNLETFSYDEVVTLYLQRSGQYPLHIELPHHQSFSLPKNDAARIKCLSMTCTMDGIPGGEYEQALFPNVTRLTIHGIMALIPASFINPTRFPALRHLLCETKWLFEYEHISLPPLESLSLVFSTGRGAEWSSILVACKTTLASLRFRLLYGHPPHSRPCITLPKLQCLEIQSWHEDSDMWLDLETPALTTYIEREHNRYGGDPLHPDLETIVYMRTDRIPRLHLLPKLRQLQLTGSTPITLAILDKLQDDVLLCPELEGISQVVEGYGWTWMGERRASEMNKVRAKPISLMHAPHTSNLPGAIPHSNTPWHLQIVHFLVPTTSADVDAYQYKCTSNHKGRSRCKKAIEEVERQLQEALHSLELARIRVANIRSDLQQRRAWLSPIRRLNFDVLCRILELAAEEDWKAPIGLASVSRIWRFTALCIPHMWCFLDLKRANDPKLINLYLERSGQRLLHIGLPHHVVYTTLAPMKEHLQCLSIYTFPSYHEGIVFPQVTRLYIRNADAGVFPADVTRKYFPALRHLYCHSKFIREPGHRFEDDPNRTYDLPPLETLDLQVTSPDTTWVCFLRNCSKTVTSLHLVLRVVIFRFQRCHSMTMPLLKCLEVSGRMVLTHTWCLNLKTPVLESYISDGWRSVTRHSHSDLETVKQMRLSAVRQLVNCTNLRCLQILNGVEVLYPILAMIEEDATLCPRLELIIVEVGARFTLDDMELARMRVEEVSKGRTGLKVLTQEVIMEKFKGEINVLCGVDMPCS